MALETFPINPDFEVYNVAITRLSSDQRRTLFMHDFKGLVGDPLMHLRVLGIDGNDFLEALGGQKGYYGLLDHSDLRADLVTAIDKMVDEARRVAARLDTVQIADIYKRGFERSIELSAIVAKLAPILLKSFDYFSSLDPDVLQELQEQSIDVRDICTFFHANVEMDQDIQDPHQIDGARAIILFNLLRNADTAHNKFVREHPGTSSMVLSVQHGAYQVRNSSTEPFPRKRLHAMQQASQDHMKFGLFIASYYTAVSGDLLELDEQPIDPADETRGYQIGITLRRNQSAY